MSTTFNLNAGGTGAAVFAEWPGGAGAIFSVTKIHTGALDVDGGAVTAANPFFVQLSNGTTPYTIGADVTSSGALGALNAAVSVALAGCSTAGFQLTAGTLIGTIVPEVSYDGGTTWFQTFFDDQTTGAKVSSIAFTASNTLTAKTVVTAGGASHVRVRVSAFTSGTANAAVRATSASDPSVLFSGPDKGALPPTLAAIGGVSGNILRPFRVGRAGHIRPGNDTLMFHDAVEGTTVNTYLWAQSTTTQTIAQTTGVLTLNNAASVATTTNAIITSNKQFQIFNHAVMKLQVHAAPTIGATNSLIEIGFGAPAGTTAIISNGMFFRINGTTVNCCLSFNGTEQVVAQTATLVSGRYYMFSIYQGDDDARFIIEDSGGVPVVDTSVPLTVTVADLSATSHLPAFARTYNSAAVGTASKLAISSFDVIMLDYQTNKSWGEQLASIGRHATLSPTAYTQTPGLANATVPTSVTASNTASPLATLGGEYAALGTAGGETILSLFGYQVPSPYMFYLRSILIAPPLVQGAAVVTATYLQWFLAYNASSANMSTATGIIRVPLPGWHTAIATAAIGTQFTGAPVLWTPPTPIVCLPGTFLHLGYKAISGAATASLVYRGAIIVDGYFA